jgi:hypothetical protein
MFFTDIPVRIGILVARLAGAVHMLARSYSYMVEPIENSILLYISTDAVIVPPACERVFVIDVTSALVCRIFMLSKK